MKLFSGLIPALFLMAAPSLTLPAPLEAVTLVSTPQVAQGSISGRITDVQSGQPLSAIQVYITELQLGTLSRGDGRYLLPNVQAGTYTLIAERIGYVRVALEVAVQSGQTLLRDFEMQSEALALDAIVVTGTVGQARRREVGNSVVAINVADRIAPAATVDQLLQGSAPGIAIKATGGSVGTGSVIRLRGITSLSQGNQPLIYVDGVRIRSESIPVNRGIDHPARGAHQAIGGLSMINPADIERIEVVKGPAAATLYGSEAAAGVIQIFTKRGATSAPEWTLRMEQGANVPRQWGPDPLPFYGMDETGMQRNGWRQRYNASITGGTSAMSYYVSGGFERNEGIQLNDLVKNYSLRGNVQFLPSPELTIRWNSTYVQSDLTLAPNGNNSQSPVTIHMRRNSSSLGSTYRERVQQILNWQLLSANTQAVTGLTLSHAPTANISQRLTFGLEQLTSDMRNIRPFGFLLFQEGIIGNTQWTNSLFTVDYAGSVEVGISENLRSTWSVGGQYISEREADTWLWGRNFPGPGEHTSSSGATTGGEEKRSKVNRGGLFAQMLFGYHDRYFVTLGLRLDGNSVFGEDFGIERYPKISASYVISDEAWWSPSWGEAKLRGAYGTAGQAPGAFDALRTWTPAGFRGTPGFLPGTIGNPNLGPERSVELEVGFDSSLLDGRLAVDFTYYRQTTEDALFAVSQIPSVGFGGSQLENVGKIRNRGIELSISGDVLQSESLGWNVGATLATNNSLVLSLGGASEFSLGGSGWVAEGQPAPAIRGPLLLNPDEIAAPQWEDDHFFGPHHPTRTIGVNSVIRLPRGITLSAMGEYQSGGFMRVSGPASAARRGSFPACDPESTDAYNLIATGRIDELTAQTRAWCDFKNSKSGFPIFATDYGRLRHVTLQVPLPTEWFGVSVSRATLTLSAQNYFSWLPEPWSGTHGVMDPESGISGYSGSVATAVHSISEVIPPMKFLTSSIQVRF